MTRNIPTSLAHFGRDTKNVSFPTCSRRTRGVLSSPEPCGIAFRTARGRSQHTTMACSVLAVNWGNDIAPTELGRKQSFRLPTNGPVETLLEILKWTRRGPSASGLGKTFSTTHNGEIKHTAFTQPEIDLWGYGGIVPVHGSHQITTTAVGHAAVVPLEHEKESGLVNKTPAWMKQDSEKLVRDRLTNRCGDTGDQKQFRARLSER